MIAPLLTFALQAATYQAGIPTHNYNNKNKQDQRHAQHNIFMEKVKPALENIVAHLPSS